MNMPLPEGNYLCALIRAHGVHGEADFIADGFGQEKLLTLANATLPPAERGRLEGKAVLLALPRQLSLVAALVALDGIAGRLILWPNDEPITDLAATMAYCGADAVVTSWPPCEDGSTEPAEPAPVVPTIPLAGLETAWVLFTSGSTGTPKMVVHTLRSLGGHLIGRPSPGGKSPVWSTFYNVCRYGGLQIVLRTLLCGGSLLLARQDETPASFLTRAAAAGASHFLGTPSHWRRVLLSPEHRLISPAYVRLSGEVANQAILDQLRCAYPDAILVHAFASTEAGLGFEVPDGQAGFPAAYLTEAQAGVDIRVAGGTLQLRSARRASQVLGFAVKPLADDQGFVDTGDEVVLQGGRYMFAGRRDGVINVGGRKVHPEEVESVINQHPAVQMSRVAARRNPITGAIVTAEIVSRPMQDGAGGSQNGLTLEDDIKSFCRERLPPHKVPAIITQVANLPIAASGKMVRLRA
jgi:acyl-coenzyme A synthetase/AMP-(fatty) acid ligase